MFRTRLALLLVLGIASFSVASIADAAKIENCEKRGPSKSTGDFDHFRDAKVAAAAGRGQVFSNNERTLPKAGKNQSYYEYDLGQDGSGGRGARRAVLLVQKGKVLVSFFTQDHYRSFCKI